MRIFALFGGLLLALLIATLIAPFFINWSAYTDRIEVEIERLIGYEVRLGGDAEVRLLPIPSASFGQVRIGPENDPIMTAEGLTLETELAPLLQGQVQVSNAALDRPQLHIELDDLGRPVLPLSSARGTSINPQDFSIEHATISDGEITVLQRRANGKASARTLASINGTLKTNALNGPFDFDGDGVLDGIPVSFEIGTGVLAADEFGLTTRTVWPDRGLVFTTQGSVFLETQVVYDAVFQLRPSAEDVAIAYDAEGLFRAGPSSLDIEQYRATIGSGENPYVVEGTFSIDSKSETPRYAFEARGVQLQLGNKGLDGEGIVDFALINERSQQLLSMVPLPDMPGSIAINLPSVVIGDTVLRDIKIDAVPERRSDAITPDLVVRSLNANLPGRTVLETSGKLIFAREQDRESETRFDGDIVLASRQPSGLANWLGMGTSPELRSLGGAGLEGQVSVTQRAVDLKEADFVLGDNRLAGDARLNHQRVPKMLLTADLTAVGNVGTSVDLISATLAMEPAASLPIDFDVSFRGDELLYGAFRSSRVELDARFRDELISVDRFLISDFLNADLSATATIAPSNRDVFAVDASVVSANLGPLLSQAGEIGARFDMSLFGETVENYANRTTGIDPNAFVEAQLNFLINGGDSEATNVAIDGNINDTSISGMVSGSQGRVGIGSMSLSASDPAALAAQLGVTFQSYDDAKSGESRISADFSAGSEADHFQTSFSGNLANNVFEFSGQVSQAGIAEFPSRIEGGLTLEGSDLRELAHLVSPQSVRLFDPQTTYSLATPISANMGESLALTKLQASVDRTEVLGDLNVDFSGARPKFDGALRTDHANLVPLITAFTGNEDAKDINAFAQMRFAAATEIGVDFEVELEAATVRVSSAIGDLKDFRASLSSEVNAFTARDLSATWNNAALAVSNLSLQNDGGAITGGGQVDVTGLNILETFGQDGLLTGSGSLAGIFTWEGESFDAVARSIAGSGTFDLTDAAVASLSSDGLAAITKQADLIGFNITQEQISALIDQEMLSGTVGLSSVSVPILVREGVLTASNLVTNVEDAGIFISADISRELASAKTAGSVSVRYQIDGGLGPELTWQADETNQWERDDSSMVNYLTQRAADREQQRIEALQARLIQRQRLRRSLDAATLERDARERREQAERDRQAALAAERAAQKAAEEARVRAQEQERRLREREREAAQPSAVVRPRAAPADPFREEVLRESLPPPQDIQPEATPNIFEDLNFGN
ncbi:MAG: AsmA family protein [Pseudomonadota bacterium]